MLKWLRNRENGIKTRPSGTNFQPQFDYSHYHLLDTRIDEDDIVQRMISYTPDYQYLVAAWSNFSTQDSLTVWNTGKVSILFNSWESFKEVVNDLVVFAAKVGRLFMMVDVSMMPNAKVGRNDHRENAPHFKDKNYSSTSTLNVNIKVDSVDRFFQ